jgi:hypothetical protein
MIVYPGPVDDPHEVIQFLRKEAEKLRALRKIVVSPEKTVILDVNSDRLEFPGLTYGSRSLEELLRELGVIFTPARLHDPKATASGIKEFLITAKWTWGHDRVL